MRDFLPVLGRSALLALPVWAFLALRVLIVGRGIDRAARLQLLRRVLGFAAASWAAILPLSALRGRMAAPFGLWLVLALAAAWLLSRMGRAAPKGRRSPPPRRGE